ALDDVHRIGHHADVRVENRMPGGDVIFPRVPRASEDPPLVAIAKLVDAGGQGGANHPPESDPGTLMRAGILERVEMAVEIEEAILSAFHPDDLAAAGWDLLDPGDDVCSHACLPINSPYGSARGVARRRRPARCRP